MHEEYLLLSGRFSKECKEYRSLFLDKDRGVCLPFPCAVAAER